MPDLSITATDHFQQLFNRVNDLLRKNTQMLRSEAAAARNATGAKRAGHLKRLDDLKAARVTLLHQHDRIFEAEQKYEASHRAPNEAEAILIAATRSANALVRSVEKVADFLTGVAKFADAITRLIGAFS